MSDHDDTSAAHEAWQNERLIPLEAKRPPRPRAPVLAAGGDPDPLYVPTGNDDYLAKLGFPGEPPFTRGVQPNMYRGRLWTMRQYAGFGTAAESNARYHYLLGQGQTGLSVAFDLPTQMGRDSDHERSAGEVGKVGVAIAVEHRGRTAGFVRLAVIPRATTAVLTSFVKDAIVPQAATVHTDAWAAYKALSKMGIDHRPRKGGHGRHAEDGLPWAHTVFGNLKTWLRGAYHGVSPKHLQRYLNEFQFRFNKRWHEADLFSPVLHAAIKAEPFPYRSLTAEPTG